MLTNLFQSVYLVADHAVCIYVKYALWVQVPSRGKQFTTNIFKKINTRTGLVLDHIEDHGDEYCPCFKGSGC